MTPIHPFTKKVTVRVFIKSRQKKKKLASLRMMAARMNLTPTKIVVSLVALVLVILVLCLESDSELISAQSFGPSLRSQKVFTKPSPHLWKDIPIVPPDTNQKKVLVTGAGGFIGSSVAYKLLERGDKVIVVDEMNDYYDVRIKEANLEILRQKAKEMNEKDGAMKRRLEIYIGDINDHDLMKSVFERENPDYVCHLAARAGVRPSIQDPLLYVRANVQGSTNMLNYSRDYNVKNIVVASSSSVYGESGSTFFSEAEDVNEPVSPYAATKRSVELISYTYHHLYNMNITNLRFFTVYGPRGRPDMAPFIFISRVTRGEEIEQYGDGSTSRDYTYIDDIVDGVIRAIDRPYPYQIFNLGKGSGTNLGEFIELIEKHVGKKANIKVMPAQPGDVPFTNADVSKARRLLGYEPHIPMEEGIIKTVAWFKETYGEDGEKMFG
mmetsp:Transcript_20800/g.43479  ORF Transcript_20800/g.43479 Transcript_20800/m.43479 type:complete len:438 (+) Transcript_20800:84-1397(+)